MNKRKAKDLNLKNEMVEKRMKKLSKNKTRKFWREPKNY